MKTVSPRLRSTWIISETFCDANCYYDEGGTAYHGLASNVVRDAVFSPRETGACCRSIVCQMMRDSRYGLVSHRQQTAMQLCVHLTCYHQHSVLRQQAAHKKHIFKNIR